MKWSSFDNGVIPPLDPELGTPSPHIKAHPSKHFSTGKHAPKSMLRVLLHEPTSLTQRLSSVLQQEITADVLSLTRVPLQRHWRHILHERQYARWYRRDTCLKSSTGAWILAQTLLPPTALDHWSHALHHCGAQPIGNLLFTENTSPTRHWIFCGQIPVNRLPAHWQRLWKHTSQQHSPHDSQYHSQSHTFANRAWVRQSLLLTTPKPLAITEVFLNPLCHHIQRCAAYAHVSTTNSTPRLHCPHSNAPEIHALRTHQSRIPQTRDNIACYAVT